MNGDEILDVLKQIRDEAKQTNVRLESLEGKVETTNTRLESLEGRVDVTNTRLESLEGRVDVTNTRLESLEGRVDVTNTRLVSLEGRVEFLERRVIKGFEELGAVMEEFADAFVRKLTDTELRLATAVLSHTDTLHNIHERLVTSTGDHQLLIELEHRVRALESRRDDHPPE